jgi:hypothetical protein
MAAGNRVQAWDMSEDEETGRSAYGDAHAMPVGGRAGPVAEQVDSRPPSDQLRKPESSAPSSPAAGSGTLASGEAGPAAAPVSRAVPCRVHQLTHRYAPCAGATEKKARVPTGDDRTPFALIDVDLHSVPSVDTQNQKFTADMAVRLRVFIPELREKSFKFSGCAIKADADGAFREPLELQNFPLDVQRLHATYEFELSEESLGKDVSRSDVMERLYNIRVFDESKKASVAAHDDEWALYHDAMEIYARPMSSDKLRVRIVLIVKRRPMFYAVNVILPVWCIVLFSFISFQFGAAELDSRLQVRRGGGGKGKGEIGEGARVPADGSTTHNSSRLPPAHPQPHACVRTRTSTHQLLQREL